MSNLVLYLNTVGLVGGAEQSLLILLAALDRCRYTPVLICPADSPLEARARTANIRTIGMPIQARNLLHNPYVYVQGLIRLYKHVRNLKPTLIHGNGLRSVHYTVPLAKLSGIPSIMHIRDIDMPPSRLTRMLLQYASRQIAISHAVHTAMGQQGILGQNCNVIHNGVDVTLFQQVLPQRMHTRQSLGLAPDDVAIGLIGRLLPWKGHEYFIQAAEQLKQQPALRWLIVGGAWSEQGIGTFSGEQYRAELHRRIRESGLDDRVQMLGARDDIPAMMAALDIVVIPSVEPEPFGRVAIEAMAAARPVIGTDSGGLMEIIADKQSGYIIPRGDTQAIVDHIRILADNPKLREQMGQTGLHIVWQKFTHEQYVQRVTKVYDTMLNNAVEDETNTSGSLACE